MFLIISSFRKTKIGVFYLFSICVLVFASSCKKLIDYSPYDVDVNYSNLTAQGLEDINKSTDNMGDTVRFIVFADTHNKFDDLDAAVSNINKLNEIDFVVCNGDLTDCGLSWEYNWYAKIIQKLKFPSFTAIGNHDYRSNGDKVYRKMFGESNTSFWFHKTKFVLFDDIVWENNNARPNFEWLDSTLITSESENAVLITHIPPFADQLTGEKGDILDSIIETRRPSLCLYGHEHKYNKTESNGITQLVAADISQREYYIITMIGRNINVETVKF